MRLYECVMIFCKWCYGCNMSLERIGSFLQQCLAGENKSRTVAGDEESDLQFLSGIILMGIPAFYLRILCWGSLTSA